MDHEDIPYYHSGIKELDEETYELLKRFALTYGSKASLKIASMDLFTRETKAEELEVENYHVAWEYSELAMSYRINFIDSPENPKVHLQAEVLITELIGDEKKISIHLYNPSAAQPGNSIGYQEISLEKTKAEIAEQEAWHAEIDSHRPPRKPGELRVYLGKATTDDIAREKELRLHLLKESEIHLQASKL